MHRVSKSGSASVFLNTDFAEMANQFRDPFDVS